MFYTAEVRFDGPEIADRLRGVTEWFKARSLPLGPFRYTMGVEMIRLRVDFADLSNASDFAEGFGGVVLGASSAAAESAA
jgi:hypothetical protein